ncbi:MAG: hypothetical protein ACREYF_27605, partial [Gammaproteobacteria bacterium]
MKNPSEKRSHFKAKTIAVSSVLLTFLATLTVPVQAGSAAWWWNWTGDFTVSDSANWQTIRALNINGGAHAHFCQAVASLDATGPSGDAATQYYFFTLTVNNANPILGGDGVQRTIEMRNQPGVN